MEKLTACLVGLGFTAHPSDDDEYHDIKCIYDYTRDNDRVTVVVGKVDDLFLFAYNDGVFYFDEDTKMPENEDEIITLLKGIF